MSFVTKYLQFEYCPIFYHMSIMGSNSWRGTKLSVDVKKFN